MGNHVWRPLFVVIGIVILILIVRFFYVPHDFGIHQRGYMYGWYREGNIEDWKKVQVKYKGEDYCKDCHADKFASIMKSPHAIIQCENCHGPAIDHPDNPPKLTIDRSRALCLRCHYPLAYPTSGRAKIKGIDPDTHNRDFECSTCHNPHKPNLSIQ
jgi:predicted CXXCH cytochrome family protein